MSLSAGPESFSPLSDMPGMEWIRSFITSKSAVRYLLPGISLHIVRTDSPAHAFAPRRVSFIRREEGTSRNEIRMPMIASPFSVTPNPSFRCYQLVLAVIFHGASCVIFYADGYSVACSLFLYGEIQ